MILAFDTYYFDTSAKTVFIAFDGWTASMIAMVHAEVLENPDVYTPGAFYKRELPCIASLLNKVDKTGVQAIIIDGFVYLDDNGRLGLGGHLYNALHGAIPIIGVAKNDFVTIKRNKRAVFRGKSLRPLYVTSVGMELDQAAENIKRMAGAFRMPALLKELDQLTKS